MSGDGLERRGGAVAWMAGHPVAANLLMAALLLGGLFMAFRVKQEVFPEFSLDIVGISVIYPGASPEEVEEGIVVAIEDAVRGLDGVKKVTSTASEGRGSVSVEVLLGKDPDRMLSDVKNAVDRITTFPEEAERPIVNLLENRNLVLNIAVAGDFPERTLRETAERLRDDLSNLDGITLVQLGASKPLEIAVEIPQATLRAYGITLDQVAAEIRRAALDLPAGSLKTEAGEILFRTTERRDFGREFGNIPIISNRDGSTVRGSRIVDLGDARCGHRRLIEVGEQGFERTVKGGFDHLDGGLAGERCQTVAQRGEILGESVADKVGPGRQRLAKLDKGRPQRFERGNQPLPAPQSACRRARARQGKPSEPPRPAPVAQHIQQEQGIVPRQGIGDPDQPENIADRSQQARSGSPADMERDNAA